MHDALQTAPAGYRLGDPIALEDLLALPPDGRRYTRDEGGRLALMNPDDARGHRYPLGLITERLIRALQRPWRVIPEPGVAFDPVWSLQGRRLPPSRLGRKTVGPDVGVFAARPRLLAGRPDAVDPAYHVFSPEHLRLVVELVSPGTWRSDLGLGEADEVDRWRTYHSNGLQELWLVNAGLEACGRLPARAVLALQRGARSWEPLPSPRATGPAETERGRAFTGGTIVSAAVPGLELDLDGLWAELDEPA